MRKFLSINSKSKFIFTMLIISVILTSFSITVLSENEIVNNLEDEQNVENKSLLEQSSEVQKKIEESNNRLEYVESELTSSLQKIQELDDTIRSYEKQSEDLNKKIQSMEQEILNRQKQIDEVQEIYNKKQIVLKKRLVALYEAGDTSYIDVLVKSNSIIDFLSNYYMLEQMIEFDNNLLDELSSKKDLLDQEIILRIKMMK